MMDRIKSIDVVRGLVMVIMALDHVRDMIHVDALAQNPANLETTTPILFFTRWITYLCAPTFVFLAGASAFLSYKKSNSLSLSRSFLLKRGLYLILLDLLVVNFALFFDPGFHTILFEVIAAIGFGFICLGLLLNAPANLTGVTGLIIIFCHNLISFIPDAEGPIAKVFLLFFNFGVYPVAPDNVLVMAYPPVPWLGIMLVGFASGKFFARSAGERRRIFIETGLSALALFIVIRLINFYGDPAPWAVQKGTVFSFLSFINVTKYPPSLQFSLITLGIMFLVLALAEGTKTKLAALLSVYGRVPLFYFLIHFFLIHIILLAILFMQGFSWPQLDFASGTFGRPKGVQSGGGLWVVYLIWIGVVAALYKPCLWFGKYKSRHGYGWLKYL